MAKEKTCFFKFADKEIAADSSICIELGVPNLYSHTPATLPIYIKTGVKSGPVLLVTAAIHGDELNGVEIVRRLVKSNISHPKEGVLIAIPVVNLYGFTTLSRYLPDRRDLNRCFPGVEKGSLASRIAYLFTNTLMERVTHIIDLHTGSIHKTNLPQIRADITCRKTLSIAKAFGAPVILNAALRDGSLRTAAKDLDIITLVYEAGEALRFNDTAITDGFYGVLNVMKKIKMIDNYNFRKKYSPQIAVASTWIRATTSGMLFLKKKLGEKVLSGANMGRIIDPVSHKEESISCHKKGILIGSTTLPLVNEGDGIANMALFEDYKEVQHIYHDILY